MEPATMFAIQQTADEIHAVSGERIGAEIRRMLSLPVARSTPACPQHCGQDTPGVCGLKVVCLHRCGH